jgi:hypothetical protein
LSVTLLLPHNRRGLFEIWWKNSDYTQTIVRLTTGNEIRGWYLLMRHIKTIYFEPAVGWYLLNMLTNSRPAENHREIGISYRSWLRRSEHSLGWPRIFRRLHRTERPFNDQALFLKSESFSHFLKPLYPG